MDPTRLFVETVLVVAQRYSIDTKDMGTVLRKLIVLSVKFVSQQRVWQACFGDDYVDWELLSTAPGASRGLLPGVADWLTLLDFCQWDDLCKHEATMQANQPLLHGLRAHMKACALDTGGERAWTLVAKLFVLLLIKGLPSQHSIESLTCGVFKTDTHDACTQLLARQAEHLYAPAEYETALVWLLEACVTGGKELHQVRAQCQAMQEERRLNLKQSRIVVFEGRPRLRDRVATVFKTEERKAQVDVLLSTWESFQGFSYLHQFPVTLSTRAKTLLYFLASQTHWDWRSHLHRILPSSGPLLEKVAAHPVTQPVCACWRAERERERERERGRDTHTHARQDLHVIVGVVGSLSMDGSPPFPSLTHFRRECFQSFPVTHVQRLTHSQVLCGSLRARRGLL